MVRKQVMRSQQRRHGGSRISRCKVLLVRGKFLTTISVIIEGSLRGLSKWVMQNGLGINIGNTGLIKLLEDYIGTLQSSTETKYFRVILDPKLSWTRNTGERGKKAQRGFYTYAHTFEWDIKSKMIFNMYTSIIRRLFTYDVPQAGLAAMSNIKPKDVFIRSCAVKITILLRELVMFKKKRAWT